MKRIDVNVDIGEGFAYDDDLLRLATSANICCGEHAGSWELTLETIDKCLAAKVRLGMHPGFPDRETMGRRAPGEGQGFWFSSLIQQAERFVSAVKPSYIKPHGAWYNLLCQPSTLDANLVGRAGATLSQICLAIDLPVMLLECSVAADAFRKMGCAVIREGFAERGYDATGLLPRTQPGALIVDHDEIVHQALVLAEKCDSLCVHGDSPQCVETLEAVVRTLVDHGYEVTA